MVQKDKLQNTETRETPQLPLADGQVRVRIDKFALTSNNITYEAFRKRLIQAWFAFTAEACSPARPWITSQHHAGAAQVAAAYALVLGGQGDPRVGHMLSLC